MNNNISIQFYPPQSLELSQLTYVIIGAREGNNWIFVRNKERSTWELPAGHIEKDESANDAAIRELHEETGTIEGKIKPIHDYSVTIDGKTLYGRIYFAEIIKRGALPDSEIAEIILSPTSPKPTTYPYAHWKFVEVLEDYVNIEPPPFTTLT